VEVELDEALAARAEPGAVRQVLLNLLDNAVRYGPPGQTVRVGGATAHGVTRLWVDDEGPGVPARDRARIWQPFVRLARDRARGGAGPNDAAPGGGTRTGSGLGLSVVRDLVTLHGGRAWVEAAPAGGARFVFELLAVEPAGPAGVVPSGAKDLVSGPRDVPAAADAVADDSHVPHRRSFARPAAGSG
jgi:signal transduction histidine kinase